MIPLVPRWWMPACILITGIGIIVLIYSDAPRGVPATLIGAFAILSAIMAWQSEDRARR